jgi:hypothetical protein
MEVVKKNTINNLTPCVECEKTQLSRLNSLFIFSPTAIYITQQKKLTIAHSLICFWFAGTIFYSVGSAYYETKKRLADIEAGKMPKGLKEFNEKKSLFFQNSESTVGDAKSSQKVRLYMDLYGFAPYFLYLGIKILITKKISTFDKCMLAAMAGTTIGYNAVNYFSIEWLEEKELREKEIEHKLSAKIINISEYQNNFLPVKLLKTSNEK